MILTFPLLFAFYALLGSAIELRGAPFGFWIHDLSLRDPYYILPVVMAGSMFWQQRMMPTAGADPVQQKMFMLMPLVFLFSFLWSPSGLAVYWFTSNLMAIGQQYVTNRMIRQLLGSVTRARGQESIHMTAELDGKVVTFIQQVCTAMGLTLDASLEETPDNIRVNLTGEGADVLLKRKGEALDALQVVVNTAFRRDARGDRHYVVDALGFRKAKDDELRQMAKLLMDKVRMNGTPQEIGPLNPYARRIVHLTVAEDDALETDSVGDAFLKSVVISRKIR